MVLSPKELLSWQEMLKVITLKLWNLVQHFQHPRECLMKKEAGKFYLISAFGIAPIILQLPVPWEAAVGTTAQDPVAGCWC